MSSNVFSLFVIEECANAAKGVFTDCMTAITTAVKLLDSEFHADSYVIHRNVLNEIPIVIDPGDIEAGDNIILIESNSQRHVITITLMKKCLNDNLVIKSDLADELHNCGYLAMCEPITDTDEEVIKVYKMIVKYFKRVGNSLQPIKG